MKNVTKGNQQQSDQAFLRLVTYALESLESSVAHVHSFREPIFTTVTVTIAAAQPSYRASAGCGDTALLQSLTDNRRAVCVSDCVTAPLYCARTVLAWCSGPCRLARAASARPIVCVVHI